MTYTLPQISNILVQNANAGYTDGLIYGSGLALVAAGSLTALWYVAGPIVENIRIKSKKVEAALSESISTVTGILAGTAVGAGFWKAYLGIKYAFQNMQYYKTLGGGEGWQVPVGNGLYAGGTYCPAGTNACDSLSSYTQIITNAAYNNGVDTAWGIAMLLGSAYILAKFMSRVDWKGAGRGEEKEKIQS
jgi:hypothetical protein